MAKRSGAKTRPSSPSRHTVAPAGPQACHSDKALLPLGALMLAASFGGLAQTAPLRLLRDELEIAMALSGVRSLDRISADLIQGYCKCD